MAVGPTGPQRPAGNRPPPRLFCALTARVAAPLPTDLRSVRAELCSRTCIPAGPGRAERGGGQQGTCAAHCVSERVSLPIVCAAALRAGGRKAYDDEGRRGR